MNKLSTNYLQQEKTWGGLVNWRIVTGCAAILAVTNGLRESNGNSREGLHKTLSRSSFIIKDGVVGTIAFEQTGDRADPKTFLVKVSKDSNNVIGYKFEPLE